MSITVDTSTPYVLRLVLLVAGCASCADVVAVELPPGFTQDVLVDGLHDPNAMAFAPDGRLFVSERISGRLRVVRDGELLAEPFVTVSVPPEHPGKREEALQPGFRYSGIYHYGTYRSSGLRGIAFDPKFEQNGYVYLYYMNDSPRVNRVSRFTASRDDPDRADAGSEKVLLDIPMHSGGPEPIRDGGSHNGGALVFGRDGKLYVSVGDGWNPAPAGAPQDLTNLIGKALCINRDGSVPEDNPFCDVPDARPEIWALGFRNPYTMTVHPQTGAIYVNDVVWGKETVYELVRGGNYQHPSFEGHGEKQRPIHSAAGLIAGGAWYFGDAFPDEYRGSYFLSDWRAGVIRRMISERDRRVVDFARGLAYPTYLLVGPDGALYWLSANYELLNGKVFRIAYDTERAKELEPLPVGDVVPAEALLAGIYGRVLTPAEVLAIVEMIAPTARPHRRGDRREVVEAYHTALELSGDVERGRTIYRERCAACHRLEGFGTTVGPELVAAEGGGTAEAGDANSPLARDKEWLLEAILDPGRDVAPEYRNYFVQAGDGRTIEGLLVDESREAVTLRALNGEDRTVRRDEVERFERLDRSLMPDRLEAELTPQDLADLLDYLVTMGQAGSRESAASQAAQGDDQ